MRVLIYEPNHGGHRLAYVRAIATAVANLGCSITVALGHEAPGTREYQVHLGNVPFEFRSVVLPPPRWEKPLAAAAERAVHLYELVRSCPADHLIIPYGDGLAQMLGVA